ncbi:hypothetical protein M422DRAFT_241020 [Sphaerobolus stellatus SS14]|nr:hypothetical protein M422DRAFT_241020 [Sphaerobolus stellatus SS14]
MPTSTRTRKSSIHALLRISIPAECAALTASPVVDVTRIDSPSLASFTPADIETEAQNTLSRVRGASISSPPSTPIKPRAHQRILSLNLWSSAPSSPVTTSTWAATPTHLHTPPRSRSPSPPPSPTMSIPSISRTHSSAESSSLPATPPLPLSPFGSPPKSKAQWRHASPSFPSIPERDTTPPAYAYTRPYPSPHTHSTKRPRTSSLPVPSRSSTIRPRSPTSQAANVINVNQTLQTLSCARSPLKSLSALEASSKLMRSISTCAVCGVPGPDFPKCPKCGEAWCSRACRVVASAKNAARNADGGGGGRGHGCRGKV